MTTAEQIKDRAKKAKEAVISKRALLEKAINEKRAQLEKVDPNIIKAMKIDLETLTVEHWFPSLFKDIVDQEEYKRDAQAFDENILQPMERTRKSYEDYALKLLGEG